VRANSSSESSNEWKGIATLDVKISRLKDVECSKEDDL
jgi:hypothetical protein